MRDGRGFVAQRSGQQSRHGIENEHGGQLTAAEDIISDGNFVGGEVGCHAFIYPFVAAANKNNLINFIIAPFYLLYLINSTL